MVHAPPSNSFPPSHASLFYAVYHRTQHGRVAPAPTQIIEDTVWVVCLYYAKTHKWHSCHPRIPPSNIEVMKVVEVYLIWLPHNLQ